MPNKLIDNKDGVSLFFSRIFKGAGQIMLQENSLTGLLFLLGIFLNSTLMGLGGFFAIICATLAALLFKYDKKNIDNGLYGFNAALTGVAILLFYRPVFITWIFVALGSVLTVLLQHFFLKHKLTVYTLSFVLVTWLLVWLINKNIPGLKVGFVDLPIQSYQYFLFAINGFAQVIFQNSWIAGTIFFIAVFLNSRIAALYGLAGAVIAGVLSHFFSAPAESVALGLFSYNAVLCAIAFAGNNIKDAVFVLLSVVLSVGIVLLMSHFDLLQLTFPFVAASVITLTVKKRVVLP